MPLLELKNLSIGHDKKILDNINLKTYKKNLIAVIGKNGAGKSTLLKTIAGIIKKKSGNIILEKKDISDFSDTEKAKKIGFSNFKNLNIANLTVYDIVRLGRIPHTSLLGNLKKQDKQAIDNAIEQTGLKKLQKKEITKISDGQRQRTFIARLIAQKTDLLIFDEPTAFLDVEGKHKIAFLFRQLTLCLNKIIIFSTHDLKIAIQNADIIWLFKNKKIISAAPEDLILNKEFNTLFSDYNIKFNNFTADFDVKKQITGKIKITNCSNNLRFFWTKKALKRIGYKIDDSADKFLKINNDNWELSINNNYFIFNSIQKLLKKIQYD